MNLTRKSWPLGWTPTVDPYTGHAEERNGLLRMRNLHLDEEGIISLTRGIQKINTVPFAGAVIGLYSKFINGVKIRYAAIEDTSVVASSTDFSDARTIVAPGDGSSVRAYFGSQLGQNIICSHPARKKDDGTNVYDLGIDKPINGPTLVPISAPTIDVHGVYTNYTATEGTVSSTSTSVTLTDTTATGRGSMQHLYASPIDMSKFSTVEGLIDGAGWDTLSMVVQIGDSAKFDHLIVEFLLDTSFTNAKNFYSWRWNNAYDDNQFRQGVNQISTLEVGRGGFTKIGTDDTKNWSAVYGIRITIVGKINTLVTNARLETTNAVITDIHWEGSAQGPLTGVYEYYQVNAYDTGSYIGKSEVWGPSFPLTLKNAAVNVYPEIPADPQCNRVFIYRRKVDEQDVAYKVLEFNQNEWSTFQRDYLQDDTAVGINNTYNPFLRSTGSIVDEILGIETDMNGHALYMTFKEIHFSDFQDLDTYDTRLTIKLSGNPTERNLWVSKLTSASVLVGTTIDIYEITGTFTLSADGIFDVIIRPLGLDHPPISEDFATSNGRLFYMANDGIRVLEGPAQSQNICSQLKLLFEGYTRHGLDPVAIYPGTQAIYRMAFAKQKLWTVMPLQNDAGKTMFVYDTLRNNWHELYLDPIALFTEEDGILLGGFGGDGNNYLRIMDTGSTLDGIRGQEVLFQTIYDDNEQPRNRKNYFTLKITADTGGVPVFLYVAKDLGDWIPIVQEAFDGTEKLYPIAYNIGLGKSFALKIHSDEVTTFKLWNFTVEYDPRPEQNVFMHIPYTNLGTTSRKRFINYAFVIDTLGTDVTFTPLIDGDMKTPSTVNFDRKGTYIHYFDEEQVGTDIGGVLECGLFEFYNVNLDEIHSEKMPVPCTFLIIPQSDYGTPARKRHSSYKFVINTKGYNVRYTPRLDGIYYEPLDFSTNEKQVVEYFFTPSVNIDPISINIGGKLESLETPKQPFEFYGVITPEKIEVMPPRLKEFTIPENNYGIAARKRIRTIPMQINTNGSDVLFYPIIDGVESAEVTTLNSQSRKTLLHFFRTDVFGIDFSGRLIGTQPFEFYGLEKPENVETLPVAKCFDQVGPVELQRIGKILFLRFRIIATSTSIPFTLYMDDEIVWTDVLAVDPNMDKVYEKKVPKSIRGTIWRVEMGPTQDYFHRYYVKALVNLTGNDSDNKWVELK